MQGSIRSLIIATAATGGLLLAGCGDSDEVSTATTDAPAVSEPTATTMDPNYSAPPTTDPAAARFVGIMTVDDQTGDGTSIVVDSVSLEGGTGHIAIHIDVDGTPGAVVGNGPVPEGVTPELVIPFDDPAASGTYWPMLHIDNGNGIYEFPGPDAPLVVEGEPVMTPIELTVE